MDKDQYEAKITLLKVRYDAMARVALDYEKDIEKLAKERDRLEKKVASMERDNQNIRDIMTNNITESNLKAQSYLSEISSLKKELAKFS